MDDEFKRGKEFAKKKILRHIKGMLCTDCPEPCRLVGSNENTFINYCSIASLHKMIKEMA